MNWPQAAASCIILHRLTSVCWSAVCRFVQSFDQWPPDASFDMNRAGPHAGLVARQCRVVISVCHSPVSW